MTRQEIREAIGPPEIEQAMKRFDEAFRFTPEWVDWESSNYKYALKGEKGRLYPGKFIVALAAGIGTQEGGLVGGGGKGFTNKLLQDNGFKIEPI